MLSEIAAVAREYASAADDAGRYAALHRAYSLRGRPGVEALAHMVGADPAAAVEAVELWLKNRRRARRGQKPIWVPPPPAPPEEVRIRPGEAREEAGAACGARACAWLAGPEGGFRRGRLGAPRSPELARAWDGLKGGGK